MLRTTLRDEYLRKALAAEKLQGTAQDPQVKQSWERIAVGYVVLADMATRAG